YTFEVDPEGDFEDGSGDEYDVETAKVIAEPRGEQKVILEEAIAARTSKNGIMDVKIRALKLPGLLEGNMIRIINGVIEFQHSAFVFHNPMRGDITSVILPILRSELVEIETLEVPGLVYFRSEKFYEALARKYCSGLRHLILPPCHCSDHPATVCSFIRGATGLKTVRGHGCGYRGSKSSKIISTLLAHHFRTLEELEFSDFNIISGSDMQAILASCMNLKRFWITSRDEYDHELGIRYQDIVDHEWACLGVQELSLSLDRTVYTKMGIAAIRKDLQASRARESLEEDTREELDEQESDLDQLGDEEQQRQMNSLAAKLVYTQIGRLSMLETLALGITRRLYRYSGMDDDFDWSVYDDLDRSIDDDLDRSISDDLYRSIGDDLDRSIGDDLGRSIGDDLGRSIGDDLDQSIGDDLDRSIGDDLNQSIGDDPDWIVRQVWDLTLSKGWLAELSGSKKLRHLHMRADFWSRMGQEEVEFMDAEWPVLGDISFDMEKRKFPKLMEQPHWRPSTARLYEVAIDHDCKQAGKASVALCTNLRRINAVLHNSPLAPEDGFWLKLKPLLRTNNNLTHLNLEFQGFTPPSIEEEFSALSRLHHLTIRTYMLEQSWFLSLLRASLQLPRLSELYCHFIVESGDYTFEGDSDDEYEGVEDVAEPRGELKTILEEAIAARTSETGSMDVKIKALRFPEPREGDITSIILPVLRSELVEIETFEVPELYYYRPEKFYEEVARKYCPELRNLIIPPYYTEDHPAAVCSFIRGALGLKTVRGDYFSDAYGSISNKMMPTLVQHQFKTLEEVEFLHCRMIKSSDQQDVLTSCKHLKRFWVVPADSYKSEHGLRFQDIVNREWSCLGLKELCLTLNRTIDAESARVAAQQEWSTSSAQELSQESKQEVNLDQHDDQEQECQVKAWAAKQVFIQIGRLVVLETLALGTDESPHGTEKDGRVSAWDLTLSKGWLAELAGLKNLRHLHMRTDYWSEMGQAEVEFMDAKWSLLGEISFDLKKSELCDLVKQPHWQWLQQKRSELRLSALHL
ncbi:hypothetical protein BGZ68_000185, partial [Mortierella alpina]